MYPAKQSGYLLVEAVLATFVISVALLVAVGMFITSTKANKNAAEYTVAANLAQKQLEVLKGSRNASVWTSQNTTPPNNLIPWQVTVAPHEQLAYSNSNTMRVINGSNMTFYDQLNCNSIDYLVHTDAVIAPESTGLVQVTVTVSWLDFSSQTQFLQVTTFYSKT